MGQKYSLMSVFKLITKASDEGIKNQLYRLLTGQNLYKQDDDDDDDNPPPPKIKRESKKLIITQENVQAELLKYLQKQFGIEIAEIAVTQRSCDEYPFKLVVRCFVCQEVTESVRLTREKSSYTRFRAEKYIAHVKECQKK